MRRAAAVLISSVLLVGAGAGAGAVTMERRGTVTRAELADPRGDADGRSAAGRRAADIRTVEYVAPRRPGGRLRVSVGMQVVTQPDGLPQRVVTTLVAPNGQRAWRFSVDHDANVRIVRLGRDGSTRRIDAGGVEASVTYGRRGFVAFSTSTEWLPVERVRVITTAYSRRAVDVAPRVVRLDLRGGQDGIGSQPAEPR